VFGGIGRPDDSRLLDSGHKFLKDISLETWSATISCAAGGRERRPVQPFAAGGLERRPVNATSAPDAGYTRPLNPGTAPRIARLFPLELISPERRQHEFDLRQPG
jgi:hypothetical protein